MGKKLLAFSITLASLLFIGQAVFAQGISTLDQWKSDGTNITQRTASKPLKITGLTTGLCLTLNGSGIVTTTTCGSGSGGTGSVGTSSVPTIGRVPYWTTSGATPELLGSVATGTISQGTGISISGTGYLLGGNITITNVGSGSSGTGNIATSTNEVAGRVGYFTGNSGTPALLGQVATGTITGSGGVTATAGQSIIGSGLTIGCTAASSGVTGCLTGTNWDTFNNKQATISATYPITLSGATVGWGGLGTSSPFSNNQFVYTSNTGTLVTAASSSLSLPNTALQNSTISGVALGSSLSNLTINNAGSGSASGATYNGSAGVTISYNTIGAAPTTRNINTTFPIQGGGDLSADRTITSAFGTSSTIGVGNNVFLYTSNTGVILGAASSSLSLPNTALQNSAITFTTNYPFGGGGSVALGGTFTPTWLGLGTTSNSGLTANQFLYTSNSGVLTTAASSSFFGYTPLNPTRQLTVAGTANQITSSAAAQDLTSDKTWTLSLPNHVIFPANFQATNSTTTNATTTGSQYFTGITGSRPLYVDSTGKLGSAGTGTSGNCVNWGANNTFGDAGAACGSGGGASFGKTFELGNNQYSVSALIPTTTVPLFIQSTATSSFQGGISAPIFNATSTTASSTFANGINLTAGCFSVLGICISGGGSGSVVTTTHVATTTANKSLYAQFSVVSGDTVLWWAQIHAPAGNCNLGSAISVQANIKQSTMAATSTSNTADTGGISSASVPCSANAQGYYTATTTETVTVSAFQNGATNDNMDLIAQKTSAGGGSNSSIFAWTPTTNFNANANATTTPIWLRGSPYSLFASSTAWIDQLNVGSSTSGLLATSTFFGNLSVRGTASTTNLIVSSAGGVGTRCAQFDGFGFLSPAAASCGTGGFAFPFTPTTNFNANSNATSTPIYLTGSPYSLFASSTSWFDQINVGSSTAGTLATSTFWGNLLVKGTASTTNLIVSSAGGAGTRCAQFDTFGTLSANASACGSGGGGASDPFTHPFTWASASTTVFSLGTSTPTLAAQLTVGSSTAGQLALVDNLQGANDAGFVFRNVGNFLYLSTSSPNGTQATSTTFAMMIASSSSVILPEMSYATSTSMNVDWYAGNNQRINIGTSNVTITFTDVTAGASLQLTICNPKSTGGTVTFTGGHYSGGVQPGNTTTANQCDKWWWDGTLATSTANGGTATAIPFLSGMVAGYQ
jgi:hypothetical protein